MNQTIETIVNSKHLAVVGVSDKKMGGLIYKTLKQRGYNVYAVHPTRLTFEGDKCYPSLASLPAEVNSAIVAVSPKAAEAVVESAKTTGITTLWFQQGKNVSTAVLKAQTAGLETVSRKCILMYARPVTGIHAAHRLVARVFGRL